MRRDLKSGLAWFAGFFALDTLSSLAELSSALGKVKADPGSTWIARREVAIYLGHMMSAYALMGLYAGLVLYLMNRALPGGRPLRRNLIFIGLVTLWVLARGTILWPLMHYGWPGRHWWAGHVDPGHVTAGFLLAGAAILALEARRVGLRPAWLAAFLVSLGLASLGDHVPRPDPIQKNKGPNILIFGVDALRPDHLHRNGYERETAPELEKALSRMTVFDNAFTPVARTWDAWNTILTGTYPATHGKRWSLPAPGEEHANVPLIAEVLQKQGYHTRFLTDDSRFSFMLPSLGFDVVDEPQVGFRAFAASRLQPNFRAFFTWLNGPLGWLLAPAYRYNQAYGITYRPDAFARHAAQQIAEASRHDRFFLAIHVCPLHPPADRPWPYHRMYGMADYQGSSRYRYRSYGSDLVDGPDANAEAISRSQQTLRQQNFNLYDAGIAMVDTIWSGVAAALDEGQLWDNTLVIILSDHGEDFLEDDTRYRFTAPNHGFQPWGTGQVHVVLGMAGGGFTAGDRDDIVDLIDVSPTLARYAGVSLPTAQGLPLQERAPERVLLGETGVSEPAYWPRGHVSQPFRSAQDRYTLDPETGRAYQRHDFDELTISTKDRWAFDHDFWLVQEPWQDGGHRYSLFNWRLDPTFGTNLLQQYPDEVRSLYQALVDNPRRPGVPEVVEDPLARERPAEADRQRATPTGTATP